MKSNMNAILKEVLYEVSPNKEELKNIDIKLKDFIGKLEKNKRKLRLNAQIFVGGSAAKSTLIKKEHYDIDIFIRFDKSHLKQNISSLTEKILSSFKKEKVHGSRDYFKVKVDNRLFFEIVPVKKINSQKEAENVTDLSYFHVNYIKKKIKGKILDEVRLAKAFCHANGTYGAESYIKGFSGYALELLIYHYGSFLNFLNAMSKADSKVVLDTEKQYKNKNQVLMDINSAKLQSPVVLIDPTHKQRNVLAALSHDTFKRFQESCKRFLRNPSKQAFASRGVDFNSMKVKAKKSKYDFVLLEASTDRQEGDIAGSKLLKFYNHLNEEVSKRFDVKDKGFEYKAGKKAIFAFVVKGKKEIIAKGPQLNDIKHVKRFKARHKKTFVKGNRIYAKENVSQSLKDFIVRWRNSNAYKIKEMFIVGFKVLF